jgi:hypothetical protein
MDDRLKNIIAKGDKARQDAHLAQQKRDEEKRQAEHLQSLKYEREAAEWVSENIFNLIEDADNRGQGLLYFCDIGYGKPPNFGAKVPAKYLVEQIKKIDGLKVTSAYHEADIQYDCPSYPAHHSYEVRWRPEKPNRLY